MNSHQVNHDKILDPLAIESLLLELESTHERIDPSECLLLGNWEENLAARHWIGLWLSTTRLAAAIERASPLIVLSLHPPLHFTVINSIPTWKIVSLGYLRSLVSIETRALFWGTEFCVWSPMKGPLRRQLADWSDYYSHTVTLLHWHESRCETVSATNIVCIHGSAGCDWTVIAVSSMIRIIMNNLGIPRFGGALRSLVEFGVKGRVSCLYCIYMQSGLWKTFTAGSFVLRVSECGRIN